MNRRLAIALLTAAGLSLPAAAVAAGKYDPGATDTEIKIGNTMPYSGPARSEEHTSELQSLMRSSYAVFCLKKKNRTPNKTQLNIVKVQQETKPNKDIYTVCN